MPGLSFDIVGNNTDFLRKIEEIKRGVADASKHMQVEGRKMDSAFNIGDNLKKQIYEGSQSINELTDKIIKQKSVIKDIEQDVRNLSEAYKRAGAGTPKGNALFADFKSSKRALQEEKNALFELQTQQAQARLSVRKLKDEYNLYKASTSDVINSNKQLLDIFKNTPGPIGKVTSSIEGMTKAALRFLATPLGLTLAAISAGLAAVTSWFNRTEAGQDALNISSARFKQTMAGVMDVVDDLGESLYKAFTDPQSALEDLTNGIKNKLLVALNSYGKMGAAIKEIFSGDTKQGLKDLGTSYLEGLTGTEDAWGKLVKYSEESEEKVKKRIELAKIQNQYNKDERKAIVDKAKAEKEIAKLREKAYDMSIPEKERAKALKEASKLTDKVYDDEMALAKTRYHIIKETNNLSHSNAEDKKREAEAEAEITRIESQKYNVQRALLRQSNRFNNPDQAAKAAESLRAQQEKYNLLLDEQTRKRVRAEEDAANEIRQAIIDADKDGAEKVLKQRELNHDKEIQAIAREADDRKQAVINAGRAAFESAEDKAKAEDPKHVKKTFDKEKFIKSDDAIAEFLRINKVAQGKVNAENAKFNRGDDLANLLDEYQDFTDQRLAIEKKFDEDIKVLDAQRKTALENGDMEQVAKIDRSKIEAEKKKKEDLSGVAMNEFKADIDWTTLFGNLDVLSPEALNKLRDKLKAFIETAADKLNPEDLKVLSEAMTNVDLTIADKTPYEALKVGLSGYKVATEDASKAQEKLNKLDKEGKVGTKEYEDATKELTEAQRRRAESLKTITQATNNIGEKGQQVVQAGSDIVDMLTSLGVSVPESLTGALNGVGQVMDSLASIDLMKPMSIVTGITGALAGIGKTIGSIFGGKGNKAQKDTKRLEATTKRLAETEKVINSFIEKRIELLKAANIAEQKNIATTTQASIDNQKKYYEQQLQGLKGNWLLAKKGKNNNLTLEDLGIGSIKELEEFLSSDRLLELQKNGYSIRDAEQWQAIIDGNNSVLDKEKELQEVMAKNRTGISLDEAKNALDDFIRSADTSFKDVSDSFEDHMRNAMFNIVKQNYLNKAMEDWYKDLEEAMSDGKLDETEAQESKKKYEEAYKDAQNMYDTALRVAGISPESSSKQQEASKRGFETMSQDTATELNGRFAAFQGSNEEIKNSMLSMLSGVNLISASTTANGITLMEIRNIALMSNSYLEDIAGFQKRIIANLDTKLTNIERSTKIMAGS